MECPNCQRSYDQFASGDQNVIPRILTVCGHSICHFCVTSLHHNKQIQCPLCKTINPGETVQNFIKNLALLQVLVENSTAIINAKESSFYQNSDDVSRNSNIHDSNEQQQSSSGQQSGKNTSSNHNTSNTTINFSQFNKNTSEVCLDHQKPIEAFCWTDKVSLCIDCLLISQNIHKQHDVLNLEKSLIKKDIKLNQTQDKIQQIKLKIQQSQTQLNQFKSNLEMQESLQINKLTKFYQEIREQIDKRQKQQFLKITECIETKREQIYDFEQKLKDQLSEINHGDFQLLQSQFSQQQNALEQILQFNEKDLQINSVIDQCDQFNNSIQSNKQIICVSQFEIKSEIENMMKIVNDVCKLNGEPEIYTKPLDKKHQFSPIKNVMNTNHRSSHRDLSLLNSTQSRKSLIVKESSTFRKMTTQQSLVKDKSVINLSNSQRLSIVNAPASNFSSRLSNLQGKTQVINQKTLEKTKTQTQKADLMNNSKAERIRQQAKTPGKIIEENSKIQLKRSSLGQRQSSRVPNKEHPVSQSNTTKNKQSNLGSLQQKVVDNELTFEQQLRQSFSSLIPQNSQVGTKVKATLPMSRQRSSFMQRINELNPKSQDISEVNTPKVNIKQNSNMSPSKFMPQSNNTSRMLIRELMNKSVEESDNEDNSSYCSIQRLVPEQNQMIFKNIQTANIASNRNRYDRSLNATMQSAINLGINHNDFQFDYDHVQKQQLIQTASIKDLQRNEYDNDFDIKRIDSIRSQTGRNSFRAPSLREKRNEFKKEKKESLVRQLESETWLSKQTLKVESILHARQMSSKKERIEDSMITSTEKHIDKHHHNFLHFTNQNQNHSINQDIQNELLSFQKQLQNELSRKSCDQTQENFLNLTTLLNRKASIENYEISLIDSNYQSNNFSMINTIDRKQTNQSQENDQNQFIGIINPLFDTKTLSIDVLNPTSLNIESQIQIANFNHELGQSFQIVNNPRENSSFLLFRDKQQDLEDTKKILQFNTKLQIIEDSDVFDLPDTLTLSQHYRACSGFYNSEKSQIPLLIVAFTQSSTQEKDNTNCNIELLSYDFSSNIWDQLPPISLKYNTLCPFKDYKLTIYQNSIYVIGGISIDGESLSSCYKFDLEKQEWVEASNMNQARSQFALSVCGDKGIIVSGGINKKEILDSCELYDSKSDTWTTIAILNIPRMQHSSIFLTDQNNSPQLIILGGKDQQNQGIDTLEVLNFDTMTWYIKQIQSVVVDSSNISIPREQWYNLNLIKFTQ
eukprot:403374725